MVQTPQEAEGPAAGNTDAFTTQLSLRERLPIGIVVQVRVGKNLGIPVAWLDSLELVIQGPLTAKQFGIERLLWLSMSQRTSSTWPGNLKVQDLPPQRPYQPATEGHVLKWWEECSRWMAEKLRVSGHVAQAQPAAVVYDPADGI